MDKWTGQLPAIRSSGVSMTVVWRPQVYNAYNGEMIAELLAAFDTAERFDVKEAHRIGLVHEVVPSTELQAAGERILKQLLANGPDAIAQTKGCALRWTWSNVDEKAFTGLIEGHAAQRQSEEAAEGFASFLEKRPARWKRAHKPKI